MPEKEPKTIEDAGYRIEPARKANFKHVILDSENRPVDSFSSTGEPTQKRLAEALNLPMKAVKASLVMLDYLLNEDEPEQPQYSGDTPPDPSAMKVPSPGDGHTWEQIQVNGKPEYVFYRAAKDKIPESLSYDHFNAVINDGESVTYIPMRILPWPACGKLEDVGSTLWVDIRQFIWDHVDLPDEGLYDVVTAWIFYTYISEAFHVAPYLRALGPKNVGKTILLECLYYLSYRAVLSPSVSEAALFRLLEGYNVTFLLDETEHYGAEIKQVILNVLNSGYRRGQSVFRVETAANGEFIVTGYKVFGPKALAGTKELTDTLESRCIQIVMQKKRRNVNFRIDLARAKKLRSRLMLWRFRRLADLESLEGFEGFEPFEGINEAPGPLRGISDGRIQEIYAPLITLAETEETINNIAEYAKESFEVTQTEAATGSEAQIISAMIDTALEHLDSGRLLTRDITATFNIDRPEKEQWKSFSVGRAVKKLGFKPARGSKKGLAAWWYDKDRIETLLAEYDLAPKQPSNHSNHSNPSNQGLDGYTLNEDIRELVRFLEGQDEALPAEDIAHGLQWILDKTQRILELTDRDGTVFQPRPGYWRLT